MHQDQTISPAASATPEIEKPALGDGITGKGFTLRRYRVTNYRSVTDSGYLDLDRVTALIGVNESGKTNLLLPLWKLNPAGDGSIEPTSDFPKALFGSIRENPASFQFVTAEFDTGEAATELAEIARIPIEAAAIVSVGRRYNGSYTVSFPLHLPRKDDDRAAIHGLVKAVGLAIADSPPSASQAELHTAALETLHAMGEELECTEPLSANDLIRLRDRVAALIPAEPPATSVAVAELRKLRKDLGERLASILAPDPGQIEEVRDAVLSRMPVFVYYSNYGNLDSEIYLPHVVENMARKDLGTKEAAKARTLRVLFDFLGLEAGEILQLGRDFRDIRDEAEARLLTEEGKVGLLRNFVHGRRKLERGPDAQMLSEITEAKRTRSILLQSASTKLTARFAEWWKQGDYRLRFEADGKHFRIWVADARRPQEVELENRSTGLQWFLSFFLVFLHESRGAHRNAVLLLDEPGHSLHPLAQRDLSAFFNGLAVSNQIVYTTHSPFLVDADRLECARKVFVERDGSTRVSGDLSVAEGTDSQQGASFAVRAALNISIADALLGGAQPVLVDSQADQIYLSTLKTLLVRAGRFQPRREIVFASAMGPKVMQTMAALLAVEDLGLPPVVLDGTDKGRKQAKDILAAGHATCPERIVCLDEVTDMAGSQIEDVIGSGLIAPLVDRIERRPDRLFVDCVRPGTPLVAQVNAWAAEEGILLDSHWRLRLAKRVRARLLPANTENLCPSTVQNWGTLLARLETPEDTPLSENALRKIAWPS